MQCFRILWDYNFATVQVSGQISGHGPGDFGPRSRIWTIVYQFVTKYRCIHGSKRNRTDDPFERNHLMVLNNEAIYEFIHQMYKKYIKKHCLARMYKNISLLVGLF